MGFTDSPCIPSTKISTRRLKLPPCAELLRCKAASPDIMNTTEYFKRYDGILDCRALQAKLVIIIGAGSVGALLADELARLGVALLIVDLEHECMEIHNLVRHILGYDSLGKKKHVALADHLRSINPNVQVESMELDVVQEQDRLREQILRKRPDLIIVATDNQESRFSVDALAREAGVPLLGGGVYDGGVGGEVFRTDLEDPCYSCLYHYLRGEGYGTPTRNRTVDYENPDWNEFRATLALRADIMQIVVIFIRSALQCLLKGSLTPDLGLPTTANVVLFANRRVPGIFKEPLRGTFLQIPRRPNCPICGTDQCRVPPAEAAIIPEIPELPSHFASSNHPRLDP